MTTERLIRTALVTGLFLFAAAPSALAGPYADALGKCLVGATTAAEKTTLVRWMFSIMSLHPDVQTSSAVTPHQRIAIAKQTAQLVERLLTESCGKEAREAIRYEGVSTVDSSFALLGQVAGRELLANPKVEEGLAEFIAPVNREKKWTKVYSRGN